LIQDRREEIAERGDRLAGTDDVGKEPARARTRVRPDRLKVGDHRSTNALLRSSQVERRRSLSTGGGGNRPLLIEAANEFRSNAEELCGQLIKLLRGQLKRRHPRILAIPAPSHKDDDRLGSTPSAWGGASRLT